MATSLANIPRPLEPELDTGDRRARRAAVTNFAAGAILAASATALAMLPAIGESRVPAPPSLARATEPAPVPAGSIATGPGTRCTPANGSGEWATGVLPAHDDIVCRDDPNPAPYMPPAPVVYTLDTRTEHGWRTPCPEDAALVWIDTRDDARCIAVDDWADPESIARLGEIMVEERADTNPHD